jgi:hypothetical protein
VSKKKSFFRESKSFGTQMTDYNSPYHYVREELISGRRIKDCTKHIKYCEQCKAVYEYRKPTARLYAWVVYKYSELTSHGFPRALCEHCQDSTVPVEYY